MADHGRGRPALALAALALALTVTVEVDGGLGEELYEHHQVARPHLLRVDESMETGKVVIC